jgi:hypothetical protein
MCFGFSRPVVTFINVDLRAFALIFWRQNIGKKQGHKMLMKLTGVNILCAAFTLENPKGKKKTVKPSVFFAL